MSEHNTLEYYIHKKKLEIIDFKNKKGKFQNKRKRLCSKNKLLCFFWHLLCCSKNKNHLFFFSFNGTIRSMLNNIFTTSLSLLDISSICTNSDGNCPSLLQSFYFSLIFLPKLWLLDIFLYECVFLKEWRPKRPPLRKDVPYFTVKDLLN